MTTSIIELDQLNLAQKWELAEFVVAVEKRKDPSEGIPAAFLRAVQENSSLENAKLLEQLSSTLATEQVKEDEEEEEV